ncbi:MAG: hypothetical protein H0V63_00335 [Burkholderiaceae bacterium]|nr:hypothetical protein [Burkholderiaceae bacterium]
MATLATVVGCGGAGLDMGNVSGRVTIKGVAVPDAHVEFHPIKGGRLSQDVTDEDGRYELMYTIDQEGALVGDHKVSIYTGEVRVSEKTGQIESAREIIPSKYNRSTTLTQTVNQGHNTIDFDLDKK